MAVGAGAGKHAPSCLTLLLLLLATDVASFSDKPRAPPLRPMQDLLQRLEFDTLLAKEGFEFFYREAQEPCKVGARWTDANDKINGTERSLVKALPQHRFAFVTWGPAGAGRVVWHRERRVDRVFGSGLTPETRYDDVVAESDAWLRRRKDASAATIARVRDELTGEGFEALRTASKAARRRTLAPALWLDEADALLLADHPDLLVDLVASLPDVALREGIADELDARGRPLDLRFWLEEF